MVSFQGASAIVTGGASGIGRAIAEALASRGTSVLIADVDGEAANIAAKELDAGRGLVTSTPLDVRDAEAVRDVVRGVRDRQGPGGSADPGVDPGFQPVPAPPGAGVLAEACRPRRGPRDRAQRPGHRGPLVDQAGMGADANLAAIAVADGGGRDRERATGDRSF